MNLPNRRRRAGAAAAIPHDVVAYELSNRIERFFSKLKHFRRIATALRPASHLLPGRHRVSQFAHLDAMNFESAWSRSALRSRRMRQRHGKRRFFL
jgi:transposase